jgi:hypothetical protein
MMVWTSTKDKFPEKPGKARYEQIPCLVVRKGWVELLVWNCEHECWDDAEGDDYECDKFAVSHWMFLPPPPKLEES